MDDDVGNIVKKTIEPKIIFAEDTLFLAVGGCKLKTLKPSKWSRALVGLLAVYYTFHLTYAVGQDKALLFLQICVLEDNIHTRDRTSAFKQALKSFQHFIGCRPTNHRSFAFFSHF